MSAEKQKQEGLDQSGPANAGLNDIEMLYPGIDPNDAINNAEAEGAITKHEAYIARIDLRDRIQNKENKKFYDKQKSDQDRKDKANAALWSEQLKELPKALEMFDEIFSSAPEKVLGTHQVEYENWLERERFRERAMKAVRAAFPVIVWQEVEKKHPFVRLPDSEEFEGEQGPGGDFMRPRY